MNLKFIKTRILIVSVIIIGYICNATEDAKDLYKEYKDCLYQVQIIEINSGEKFSIGSAFSINTKGFLATNYHVISKIISDPTLYRIQCINYEDKEIIAQIIDVDVIHDLAIISIDNKTRKFIPLSKNELKKGDSLFSLGNPLNLGMIIVDGIYNGLIEKSFYEKILFSGSLNGGMSGGPVINKKGEVIGVNVSRYGNQISFLVPLKYLKLLIDNAEKIQTIPSSENLNKRIENQLFKNQKKFLSHLRNLKWDLTSFGGYRIPNIEKYMETWANSYNKPDRLYDYSYISTTSKDRIYLNSNFLTGKVQFRFDWYKTKKLNKIRYVNKMWLDFIFPPQSRFLYI